MTRRCGLATFAIGLLIATVLASIPGPLPAARAADGRLVLAFYYAWFDQKTWNSGKVPDVPLTPYNSDDREAMARHVEQAKSAGIDALVLNWWGKGNRTEKNLKALLEVAAQQGLRVAVDFDLNSPFMGGAASYADNLRHLHSVHASHPAYLHYQGRPVVFFYNVSRLPLATWQNLRAQADPDRTALWIAEGVDLKYQAVFDGHHLYSVTWPNRTPPSQTLSKWGKKVRKYNGDHGTAKLWVATVMPGYDDRKARPGSGFARHREAGEYYRQCWRAAIASQPQWVIINSFNEWLEGSYIEPSRAHGDLYLNLTREWSDRFRGADYAASVAPLPPPAPTVTAVPSTSTAAPSPTPMPTPTPKLPTYVFEDGAALGPIRHPGCHCGYTRTNTGTVHLWSIHCYTGSSPGEAVLLVE